MAEKEREMLRQIHDLPPQLREKFLEQIKGANMALDFMSATPPDPGGETKTEGG